MSRKLVMFLYMVDIKRGGYQRPHCDLNRGAKILYIYKKKHIIIETSNK